MPGDGLQSSAQEARVIEIRNDDGDPGEAKFRDRQKIKDVVAKHELLIDDPLATRAELLGLMRIFQNSDKRRCHCLTIFRRHEYSAAPR